MRLLSVGGKKKENTLSGIVALRTKARWVAKLFRSFCQLTFNHGKQQYQPPTTHRGVPPDPGGHRANATVAAVNSPPLQRYPARTAARSQQTGVGGARKACIMETSKRLRGGTVTMKNRLNQILLFLGVILIFTFLAIPVRNFLAMRKMMEEDQERHFSTYPPIFKEDGIEVKNFLESKGYACNCRQEKYYQNTDCFQKYHNYVINVNFSTRNDDRVFYMYFEVEPVTVNSNLIKDEDLKYLFEAGSFKLNEQESEILHQLIGDSIENWESRSTRIEGVLYEIDIYDKKIVLSIGDVVR
jgi:hypothetical protein